MIKSPLRYPGGKSRAINFLRDFVPEKFREYREPFFGGGSFGFYIQQDFEVKKLIANDLNYELYALWHSVKEDIDELCLRLINICDSYKDGKKLYAEVMERRDSNLTILDRGIDFFILNRITFSGIADSGGYSEESFQKRFTHTSIERLRHSHSVIKDFELHSEDYEQIIKMSGDNVFLFIDPPYFSASKSALYGKNGDLHIDFDHERLHAILSKTKHQFLITYDNCEFIADLYRDFNQKEWQLQYGMNNIKRAHAGVGKELLITNYPLPHNDLFE